MRINKLRKITALILLAVLSLSLLSGCSRIRDRIDAVKEEENGTAAETQAEDNTESLSEKSAKRQTLYPTVPSPARWWMPIPARP